MIKISKKKQKLNGTVLNNNHVIYGMQITPNTNLRGSYTCMFLGFCSDNVFNNFNIFFHINVQCTLLLLLRP